MAESSCDRGNTCLEYSLGLFAVLIRPAVADVANSFYRLARSRTLAVGDPLMLLAAFQAPCMAVGRWFDPRACGPSPQRPTSFFYLVFFYLAPEPARWRAAAR